MPTPTQKPEGRQVRASALYGGELVIPPRESDPKRVIATYESDAMRSRNGASGIAVQFAGEAGFPVYRRTEKFTIIEAD